MAKKVTCPTCKKKNDKENTIEVSKRHYCIPCGNELLDKRESRRTDWDRLFTYICDTFEVDKPTMLQFAQIKQFKDNGMTEIGIYYTLKYLYEVIGKNIPSDGNLGLVNYYYEQARDHYTKVYDLADMINEFEFEEEVKQVGVVMYNKFTPRQPLSLDRINWGDDEDED